MRAFIDAGWAHYVQRLHLRQNASGLASQAEHTSDDDAKRFRETLERLGPAFVKFGQLLSLRRDMLPEIYIKELQKLQDDVAPFSGAQARAIVECELGRPAHELFSEFDEAPLAAASIGQVHTARLFDGTGVVVKVQRHGTGLGSRHLAVRKILTSGSVESGIMRNRRSTAQSPATCR
jgi:ubiquinone biosynthesis protein